MREAGLRPRLAALFRDSLFIVAIVSILVLMSLAWPGLADRFNDPVEADVMAFLLLILPVLLYFAVQEGRSGATRGKRRVGLRVVRGDGRALGMPRSLLRSVVKFIPWQCAHTAIYHSGPSGRLPQATVGVLYGLAYGLVIVFLIGLLRDRRHRTLYDRIAGSVVVWEPGAIDR